MWKLIAYLDNANYHTFLLEAAGAKMLKYYFNGVGLLGTRREESFICGVTSR